MTEISLDLSSVSRPRVLVQAARFAAAVTLRRAARRPSSEQPKPLAKLIADEAELDAARRSGDAAYSPTKHVELLTALLAEASRSGVPGV